MNRGRRLIANQYDGTRQYGISWLIILAYKITRLRNLLIKTVRKLEGGEIYSWTLRALLSKHHGVIVGAYSYGTCVKPGEMPPGTVVERYVSTGPNVHVYRANHPTNRISTHPFFYNAKLGYVLHDLIERPGLRIKSDSWIGANTIILPGCRSIGIGAVVGAGAIVTKDVPDFAVVVGAPARIIRYRFTPEVQRSLLEKQWWLRNIEEVSLFRDTFLLDDVDEEHLGGLCQTDTPALGD